MALNAQDVATLSRLLDEATDIPRAQQEAWLEGLPPEHRHLVQHLREMLAREETSGTFSTLPKLPGEPSGAHGGERVGPYRLIRELGRGGMGSVWLAERADGSFERQVALKLPRLAWSEGLAKRMARERRIGARLEHPAIARLYDAGVDEHGRPYIAMEVIDGIPIDRYCRENHLDVKARLTLFVQAIKAVAYAHGRLVIHRDLKPANILVDREGQVHLLDFGIAKLMAADSASQTLTQEGRALTPTYASPEQISGLPIGVASDVYALGVTLFELLTGRLPYEPIRNTLGALEDAIVGGLTRPASEATADAATRRQLRGEVDAILRKALEKRPERRYATADAMVEDIERHLAGQTVRARKASGWYWMRKAVRRHWLPVGAVSTVTVVVVASAAMVFAQRENAALAAQRERLIRDFVVEVLQVDAMARSSAPPRRPADARLATLAQLIQARFPEQPVLQADLLGGVGMVFSQMGAKTLAVDYAARQWELLRGARATPTQQSAARIRLAETLLEDDRPLESLPHVRAALSDLDLPSEVQKQGLVVLARALLEVGDVAGSDRARTQAEKLDIGAKPILADAWIAILQSRAAMRSDNNREAIAQMARAADLAGQAAGGMPLAAEIRVSQLSWTALLSNPPKVQARIDDALRQLRGSSLGAAVRACVLQAQIASRFLRLGQIGLPAGLDMLQRSQACLDESSISIPEVIVAERDLWAGQALLFVGFISEGARLVSRAIEVLVPTVQSLKMRAYMSDVQARMHMMTGRHSEADASFEATVAADTRIGEHLTSLKAAIHAHWAINNIMAGAFDRARAVIDATPHFAPVRLDRRFGHVYPQLASWARAMLLVEEGRPGEALKTIEGLDDWDDMGTPFPTQGIHAEALCAAGRHRAGLDLMREVIAVRAVRASPDDPSLARQRAVAGQCALGTNDRGFAQEMAQRSHEAFDRQPRVSAFFKRPLARLELALRKGQSH